MDGLNEMTNGNDIFHYISEVAKGTAGTAGRTTTTPPSAPTPQTYTPSYLDQLYAHRDSIMVQMQTPGRGAELGAPDITELTKALNEVNDAIADEEERIRGEGGGGALSILDVAKAIQQDWENKMEVQNIGWEQALEGFNADMDKVLAEMRREEEVGRRGKDILETLETRARRTLPTKYFPGTEPGGAVQQALSRVGFQGNIPITGTPAAQMPNPFDIYKQAQATVPETQVRAVPEPGALPIPPKIAEYIMGLVG